MHTGRIWYGSTHAVMQRDGDATAQTSEMVWQYDGSVTLTNATRWTSLFDALRDGARHDVALCEALGDAAPFHRVSGRVYAGIAHSNNGRHLTVPLRPGEGVPFAYAVCELCGWTTRAFLPGEPGIDNDLDAAMDHALAQAQRVHSNIGTGA